MNQFSKSDEEYATELFQLYKRGVYTLECILESARFDLKSENVAKLIMEKFNAAHT